jgi:hypothetical protein
MYTVHVLGIEGGVAEHPVFASRAAAERSVNRFAAEGLRARIYRTAHPGPVSSRPPVPSARAISAAAAASAIRTAIATRRP